MIESLRTEHIKAHLYLVEDKDFVYLRRGDHTIATWHVSRASVGKILAAADILLISEGEFKRK